MRVLRVDSRTSVVCAALLLLAAAGPASALDWGRGELEDEATVVKILREVEKGGYGVVSTEELKGWYDARKDMLVVDTMPAADYKRGHLPGAVNFEFPCPEPCELNAQQQEAYAKVLGPRKDRLMVFSCEFTRCGRSHNGAFWARKLGYTNVYRHPGGLKAWRQADYPVEKGK
jgi:rhodanese-related sulfurtransferase